MESVILAWFFLAAGVVIGGQYRRIARLEGELLKERCEHAAAVRCLERPTYYRVNGRVGEWIFERDDRYEEALSN